MNIRELPIKRRKPSPAAQIAPKGWRGSVISPSWISEEASLFLDCELRRQRMTLPTADMGFSDGPMHFLTIGRDLNAPLKEGGKRPRHFPVQLEKLAGIGLQYPGNRTSPAEVARPFLPGGFQQTTLLSIPAPEIVPVEVFTFFSSRSTHFCSQLMKGKQTR
jgi:hypothetical protein